MITTFTQPRICNFAHDIHLRVDGKSVEVLRSDAADFANLWSDITGNIPFNHPQILRFNPVTRELWAGYVGIYKIKQ